MRRAAMLLVIVMVPACSPGGPESAGSLSDVSLSNAITVTSPAFAPGGRIPVEYSCEGDDVSPPLIWIGIPPGTGSVALVVDDPDAPRGTYVHWVVFDLAPTTPGLEQGTLPAGARQAANSAGDAAYKGPCPPGGSEHGYRFTVYALDAPIDLEDGAGTDQALEAIADHAIAKGTLTARFSR